MVYRATSRGCRVAWRRSLWCVAAVAAVVLSLFLTPAAGQNRPATGSFGVEPSTQLTLALIGDTPYGDAQTEDFPQLVDDINAGQAIRLVLHAGDVKEGVAPCHGDWLDHLLSPEGTLDDPLVLTPGDNEWTGCHQPGAGRHVPTKRLAALRDALFPEPGRTLGANPMVVESQAEHAQEPEHEPYVENVRFSRAGVVFATVHVVGSENDLEPWYGLPNGDRPVQRKGEFRARRAANLTWIKQVFNKTERDAAAGVLLMMHAEPVADPAWRRERKLIKMSARQFSVPVLLVHGDEHNYEAEPNYAGVSNLTRLETYGVTVDNWLAVTVDSDSPRVFSWETRTVD